MLSVVLLMELAAAIAAYALQDGIKNLLAEKINATMHLYGQNKEAKAALDFMQSKVRQPLRHNLALLFLCLCM